jgi:hypothetical protein
LNGIGDFGTCELFVRINYLEMNGRMNGLGMEKEMVGKI